MRSITKRGVLRSALALATAVLAIVVQAASAWAACPDEAVREQQHSTYLPDCRAFEMVSPAQKKGGDVMSSSLRTWAAEDGNAVAFASLTGFGDVTGTAVATDYMAKREAGEPPLGSQGWSVHAITPPQGALPVALTNSGFEPMDEAFTPNLDVGVYKSWDPLTSDLNVAGVANLYLRSGFRGTSAPSTALSTPCPVCASSGKPLAPFTLGVSGYHTTPRVAGLSADGTHVLFESLLKLTSDATDGAESGQANLYEYANGVVQNAGILPDGTPAAGAVAGQGIGAGTAVGIYMPRAFSTDGTRIAFTAAPRSCAFGVGLYLCGDLYVRDTGSTPETTVQVNASERTPLDPAGPRPAAFWAMSTDGQRVIFTTPEQLTNDDTNGGVDLYEFDASAPPGARLSRISLQDPSLSASATADVDVVVGASDDLRTVYFTSTAPLLPGDPPLDSNTQGIYMWRKAGSGPPQLRFVAPIFKDTVENSVAGSAWSIGQFVQARVSPDGRFLLFATPSGAGVLSRYGQSDYDQGNCSDVGPPGCRELYLYDANATTPQQQLQCVSCRPDGATATVSASDMVREFDGAARSAGILDHALSTDGRVFFTTEEALVPEDINGQGDVYEWGDGHVHLLSDGQSSSGASFFLDASPDGSDVFIATRTQLSGWDSDSSYDLYDVREPLAGHPAGVLDPPPLACSGGECAASLLASPAPATFSSVAFAGAGNAKPAAVSKPVKCKAGMVRKRTSKGVRCVRKPKKQKPAVCTRSKAHRKKCSKAAVRGGRKGSGR